MERNVRPSEWICIIGISYQPTAVTSPSDPLRSASAVERGGDDDGERCIQDDRILSEFADIDRARGWLWSPSLIDRMCVWSSRSYRIVSAGGWANDSKTGNDDGEDEDGGKRGRAWMASQFRSTGDDHLDRLGRPCTQDHPRDSADVPSQPFRPGSGRSTSFRDPTPDVVEERDRLVPKDVIGDPVSEKVEVRGEVVYDGDVDEDEEEADDGHCNAREERQGRCQPAVRRDR